MHAALCLHDRTLLHSFRHPLGADRRRARRAHAVGSEVTIAETLSAAGYATAAFGNGIWAAIKAACGATRFRRMVWHPAHDGRGVLAFGARGQGVGHPFRAHHGRSQRREQSRTRRLRPRPASSDRCRDHSPDRRFHEAQRRLEQSVLRLCRSLQVHFPTLPNPKCAGTTGSRTSPTRSPRWMRMLARYSMGSMNSASATTPSSCSPATTVRKRPGPGEVIQSVARLLLHAHGRLAARAFIIRWPGRIPAGRVSNEIVHQVDTYATFAEIAERLGARETVRSTAWTRAISCLASRTIQARRFPRVRGGSAGR